MKPLSARFPFALKMMLLTGALIAFLMGAGLFYLYSVSSNIITQQTESHLRDILQGGLLRFSPVLQKDLRLLTQEILSRAIPITEKELLAVQESEDSLSPEDIDSIITMPEYGRIIQELRAIKASTLPADAQWKKFHQIIRDAQGNRPGIRFAYLLIPHPLHPGYSIFLADADYEAIDMNRNGSIDDEEESTNPGLIFPVEGFTIQESLQKNILTTAKEFEKDKWGTWMTAAAPIRDAAGNMIAVLGIDISAQSQMYELQKLREMSFLLLGMAILLIPASSFFLAHWLAKPLEMLGTAVKKVSERNYEIRVPESGNDEFAELGKTFNEMVTAIRSYSENLEVLIDARTLELSESLAAVQALKQQQDADYYLTTLIANPLFRDRNRSQTVNTSFILRQKKKFSFKHWSSELGGDLCVTGNIQLRGEHYSMFFNGDAMGKSMQGAGGALVMGALINAIMVRSQTNESVKTQTPKEWLRDAFHEMQRIFESFDGAMFITCILGLVQETKGQVYYFNAEHPLPVLYRDRKASWFGTSRQMYKIGNPFQETFEVLKEQLKPGDIVILGSDGRSDFIDREDPDDDFFLDVVEKADGEIESMYESILQAGEIRDDISLLRISYLGKENEESLKGSNEIQKTIVSLIHEKKFEEALDTIQHIHAESFFYHYYRSYIAFRQNQYTAARESLEKAIGFSAQSVQAWKLLGRVYAKTGEKVLARKCLERVLEIKPDDEKTMRALNKL